MSDSRQSAMVKLFLASYDDFKARLKRRLGSEDLACDVLHETYLRVDRLDDALEVKKRLQGAPETAPGLRGPGVRRAARNLPESRPAG